MGSEWSSTTIDELKADSKGSIAIGPFGSRMKSDCYVESGIPVIRGTNITGGPNFEGEFVYITEEKADTLGSSNVYQGDLVFPHRGAIGEVGILQEEKRFVLSSSLMKLTCDMQKAHPKFLYYFFKSHLGKHELLKNASQVGTPGIGQPLTLLKSIELSLPPLPEQKAIAHILGTLDDKIELNRRMNATLEGMAQALFKSWFVDFDPVLDNAILAGNPIPEEFAERAKVRRKILEQNQNDECSVRNDELNESSTQNSSLKTHHSPQAPSRAAGNPIPDELAPRAEVRKNLSAEASTKAGFPAAFQLTEELGWIPEGWEVGCISDLAALNPESWTAKKHPDSVNYADLANTKDGRITETTAYEFGEAPSRARRVLKQHDTIIGTVRPGNRSFAYIHDDGLTGSTGFAVLRSNDAASRSFIYLGLTRDETIEVFAHLADGAAYPAIRPEVVGNTQITIPSSAVLQLFEDQAAPLIAKVGEHQKEAETLSKLRDTLLPKIISGELNIPANSINPSSKMRLPSISI